MSIEVKSLSFTQFPVAGTAQTYDASSFVPDSASTATSMASGIKTLSGVINRDVSKTNAVTPITLVYQLTMPLLLPSMLKFPTGECTMRLENSSLGVVLTSLEEVLSCSLQELIILKPHI